MDFFLEKTVTSTTNIASLRYAMHDDLLSGMDHSIHY